MEILSLTIGVKNSNPVELEKLVATIGLDASLLNTFQIDLHVMDLREEYKTMGKLLKEWGAEDDTPFFNEFDIDPYGLAINFDVTRKFKYMEFLEPLVFTIARKVSEMLNTEAIVMFQTTPVGLFNKGILTNSFEKYSAAFFADKIWKPNFITQA